MRPTLQDDDSQQFWKILDRLGRLESALPRSAFTATTTSATVVVNSASDTRIPYSDTAVGGIDLESVYDNINSRFVAPATDWYSFSTSIAIPAPGAAGTRWILRFYINNAFARQLSIDWTAATWSNDYALHGESGRVRLAAGDLVDIRVNQNSAGAITIGGPASNSYFSGGRA